MSETKERDRLEDARQHGQAQFDSIKEMVARLEAATHDDAYEAMAEELAKEAGYSLVDVNEGGADDGIHWVSKDGARDDDVFEDEDEAWLACCDANDLRPDEDEALRAIEEDALSVEVRSDWHSPGESGEATEILHPALHGRAGVPHSWRSGPVQQAGARLHAGAGLGNVLDRISSRKARMSTERF